MEDDWTWTTQMVVPGQCDGYIWANRKGVLLGANPRTATMIRLGAPRLIMTLSGRRVRRVWRGLFLSLCSSD